MAVTIAHLPPSRNVGKMLLWAITGFGVATILFGISHWFWFSILMLALTGAFDNVSAVVRHSLVQLRTPDAMRGRVSAVNNVFVSSSNELGGFESGLVAKLFGTVFSVVSGGIGTILVVLLTARFWPEIRQIKSLQHIQPDEGPEPAAVFQPSGKADLAVSAAEARRVASVPCASGFSKAAVTAAPTSVTLRRGRS